MFEHFKLDIMAVQETKIQGVNKIETLQPKKDIWYDNTWNTILGGIHQ